MRNKQLHRTSFNIPDHIFQEIQKVDEKMATTTLTGTILAIIEKGLNYYRKKERASLQEAQSQKPLEATDDQQNINSLRKKLASARMTWEKAYEIRTAQYPTMINDFWKKIEPDPHDFQFPSEYLEKWQSWKKDAIEDCKND